MSSPESVANNLTPRMKYLTCQFPIAVNEERSLRLVTPSATMPVELIRLACATRRRSYALHNKLALMQDYTQGIWVAITSQDQSIQPTAIRALIIIFMEMLPL
ncbi:hypothetical protein CBL_01265 [Carabus blaptoides fortunei]